MSGSSPPKPWKLPDSGERGGDARWPYRRHLWVALIVTVAAIVVIAVFLYGVVPSSSPTGVPEYTVSFIETGLPPQTSWSVTLGGVIGSSGSAVINFTEKNGNYTLLVSNESNYRPYPPSGTVEVDGRDVTVPVHYRPISPPLGTDFAWGVPVNATGGSGVPGCTLDVPAGFTTEYCYTIEIAGASPDLSTSEVSLLLRGSSGATVPWPSPPAAIVSLLGPVTNGILAGYCPAADSPGPQGTPSCTASNSWALSPGFGGDFESGDTLVIAIAGGQSSGSTGGLFGTSLVAVGQNGVSGTVTSDEFS